MSSVNPVGVVMVGRPIVFFVQLEDTVQVVTIFLVVQKVHTVVNKDKHPKTRARIAHPEDSNPWKPKFHAIRLAHWANTVSLKENSQRRKLALLVLLVKLVHALA